ncbi:MAG TPA: hypothetical protein VFQ80_10420 [Thermomicrobiales bacterium]|jgi:hypothetical protein|nr:hypothetical protein [Thermomicrobiales bacterium]
MDSQRFDDLTANLGRMATRRRAIWQLGVAAGLVAADGSKPATAKRRKHHATCHDRKRNGHETDVDCGGGKCRRCAIGKRCLVDNDCVSGTCASGRCKPCAVTQLCGSDANGACQCHKSFASGDPVCDAAEPLGLTVDDCVKCPAGTETCVTINGLLFNCYKHCGSTV